MKVVVAFGGSLMRFSREYFQKLRETLKDLSEKHKFYIVVGGGRIAREFIKFGREMGLSEEKLDMIGIDVTRLNARFVSYILGANEDIPKTTDEAKGMKGEIVVMGGTTSGHSTDAVAAELAEKVDADMLVIATDVDGIYDKDPKRYPDAKLFREISVERLIEMCGTEWKKAGENVVIDGPALEIIRRSKYDTVVINGRNPDNFKRVLSEGDLFGTKIIREG